MCSDVGTDRVAILCCLRLSAEPLNSYSYCPPPLVDHAFSTPRHPVGRLGTLVPIWGMGLASREKGNGLRFYKAPLG